MSNPFAPPGARPPGSPGDGNAPDEHRPDDPTVQGPDPTGVQPPHAPRLPAQRHGVRPPDPQAVQDATGRTTQVALLLLTALVAASLPLPWQLAALVPTLVAIVLGLRALTLAWRAGVRGVVTASLVLALAISGMLTMSLTTVIALWPIELEHQQCLRDALTIAAQERCEAEFTQAVTDRLGGRPADG